MRDVDDQSGAVTWAVADVPLLIDNRCGDDDLQAGAATQRDGFARSIGPEFIDVLHPVTGRVAAEIEDQLVTET